MKASRVLLVVLALGLVGGCDDGGGGASDSAAPDGSLDASVPMADGSAPDGSAPDGSAPDGSAPDGSAPDGSPGDASAPDSSAPLPTSCESGAVTYRVGGGARATRPCSTRAMSAGSLTTSTTCSRPPHRGHSMMSTPNTRLSSHAHA